MRKLFAMFAIAACAMMVSVSAQANAKDKAEAKAADKDLVTVTGKVVVKDDKVTIEDSANKVTYNVTDDANGKKLKEKAGKEVEVKGKVEEKDGVKTITVVGEKPAKAEKAEKSEKAEKTEKTK